MCEVAAGLEVDPVGTRTHFMRTSAGVAAFGGADSRGRARIAAPIVFDT